MQPLYIAKACVIPVCNYKKFNLVHKFPADKERFAEWMKAIQKTERIEKLNGLSPEAVRKRFFVCSRHFSPKEYKNIESRSLNLTAVPHLNFKNLDEIHLSKAGQLQANPESTQKDQQTNVVQKPVAITASSVSSPVMRILNSGNLVASVTSELDFLSTSLQPKVLVEPKTEPAEVSGQETMIAQHLSKRVKRKLQSTASTLDMRISEDITSEQKQVCSKSHIEPLCFGVGASKRKKYLSKEENNELTERTQTQNINVTQSAARLVKDDLSTNLKASNKLLALMEVTPEQYEKLSKSLSSAERNENANFLINFLDNDENNPNSADNEIILALEDGGNLNLDLFWLRDHCRCLTCYDDLNHQRKISILDIPDDVGIKEHELRGETLFVTWNDNHESSYELKFLIQNQPNKISVSTEHCLWNKESIEAPMKTDCRVSMRDYMSDPDVSKKVLESLHVYGVAFIDGVQPTQQNTEFVIRQLFPVHKTLFGEMWTFSDAKKDHSDTAYTNIYLGPHNDNTYFNDAAGLQILHCITNSATGGENFLIDGFQVAANIKEEHPEVYKRLTTTIVTGEYIEDGHHHRHSSPIINLDAVTGEVSQIRFNLYDRAPFKTVPSGKIRQFYSDLKVLSREFENIENRIVFKLQPGTVMIFDNWRVLHGRLTYSGKRTMTGCYVARTEFQSALRVNGFIE